MFKIIDIDRADIRQMEEGRGHIVNLVDSRLGTDKIDLHLNRLEAGGPAGKLHRHTTADNVYIVLRGEGRLQIEDHVHTIRHGQVVFIPAGTRHSLSNTSSELLELFEIYAPRDETFDVMID